MSAATHTPGPWNVGDSDLRCSTVSIHGNTGAKHTTLCRMVSLDHGMSAVERTGNILLIAAAPDLLKSLQVLVDAAQARENPMGDPCALLAAQANLRDAAKRARAVIAKATGSES